MDAKYRFKYHNNSVGPGDDAINVLHRYRDAILQTAPATTDRP
ncbi:nuclease domain-containing protein, partial [Vibrio parahaemolyticus]